MNTTIRIVVLTVAALLATPALAGLLGQQNAQFLPVDQAFQPQAVALGNDRVGVTWQIADGYYLYRHAFSFKPGKQADFSLGKPAIPAGKTHQDEFFGQVETYRNVVTVTLPVQAQDKNPLRGGIQVQYQGCADAGLCYPPQTRTLAVDWSDAAAGAPGPGPAAASGNNSPATTASSTAASAGGFVSQQDRLAGVLGAGDTPWILLVFFGLGLLLAFTPCILPMIPILSGLIVGSGSAAQPAGAGRGFALSAVYVLAMSAAYTVFGVIAGLFGTSLQAALQSPWVLVPFALLFVLLALSMFGVFALQLPAAWQTRLGRLGSGGGLGGAAVMGFAAALIVGPCLAPPLAGALLYIGSTGNAVLGGAALFTLGLGMGLPLIVLGTVGGGALPRAGAWMDEVKVFFGVLLLGVAIYLLARLLPGALVLAAWAALIGVYGVHLGALEPASRGRQRLAKAAGVIALVYAVILLAGAALGGVDPMRPLAPLAARESAAPTASASVFKRVQGLDGLRSALAQAARKQQPAVVDFYADWCVECVRMERTVFNQPQVHQALAPVAALQVDVTAYDAADRKLLRHFNVTGPPTMLFFGADGSEQRAYRLVGAASANGFIKRLHRALGS